MTEVTRLLTVNLEPKFYTAHIPRQSINYRGFSLDLTESDYEEVIALLPEYWNTDKDRMLRFVAFSDKSFYCERVKEVFNYTTREVEKKVYKFDAATPEQVTEVFNTFLQFYSKKRIEKIEGLYDEIIQKINDLSYIEYNLLQARDKILKDTDYMFLGDYSFATEEDKKKWEVYRQEWRDITEQEAWKTRDYSQIIIPVSPNPASELCVLMDEIRYVAAQSNFPKKVVDDIVAVYQDSPPVEIVKKFAEVQVKCEVMRALSDIRLPVFDIDMNSIQESLSELQEIPNEMVRDDILIEDENPKNWWQFGLSKLEDKIEKINTQLQDYDLNFTVADILNGLIESNKRSMVEYDAINLINDIQNDEGAL